MKLILVTTESDALGGVLARAYLKAGGHSPSAVIVLPDDGDGSGFTKAALALKSGSLSLVGRLALARAGLGLGADRAVGLADPWPKAIAGPTTTILHVPNINTPDVVAELDAMAPDILLSVGAPVVFKPAVLQVARVGAINLHNGRLPAYRGHFGTFWELHHGESLSYLCVHQMTARVDTGAVLAWDRVSTADVGGLLALMIEKKKRGGRLLARVVDEIARHGMKLLAPPMDHAPQAEGYFGWPTARQVLALRFPGHSASRSKDLAEPASPGSNHTL